MNKRYFYGVDQSHASLDNLHFNSNVQLVIVIDITINLVEYPVSPCIFHGIP